MTEWHQGIEQAIAAIIEGARYLVKSLEEFEPDSPGAVNFRARLREMRHTAEVQLREVRTLPTSPEREHLIGVLILALSEIPSCDAIKIRTQ
jgi:hypothetical protein